MITNRQIARLWVAKDYKKLFRELVAPRPEALLNPDAELEEQAPAAALAIVRLDELSQSYIPLYSQLVRAILCAQEADGGWGDVATTALCVRALLCGQGDGVAIERGLNYLSNLQKSEGIWPAVPLRRMPEDAAVSLFVLHQLGDQPRFRAAIRFADAITWFDRHQHSLDPELNHFWQRTSLRCGGHAASATPLFAS